MKRRIEKNKFKAIKLSNKETNKRRRESRAKDERQNAIKRKSQ